MNAAHLHLLINHLPFFGSLLSLVLFALALWKRDRGVQLSATVVSVLAALGAGAVSVGGMLLSRRGVGLVHIAVPGVATLAAFGALLVAGSTGGKIRHPEVRDGAAAVATFEGEEHEEGEEE